MEAIPRRAHNKPYALVSLSSPNMLHSTMEVRDMYVAGNIYKISLITYKIFWHKFVFRCFIYLFLLYIGSSILTSLQLHIEKYDVNKYVMKDTLFII